MISKHLKDSIRAIEQLTENTKQDLDDIKHARHQKLFDRAKVKEALVVEFEKHKSMLDDQIVKLAESNSGVELSDLLSDEEHLLLESLKDSLEDLREHNKKYAVMALSVGEFYTSLLNAILPKEEPSYGRSAQTARASTPSFLQIKG